MVRSAPWTGRGNAPAIRAGHLFTAFVLCTLVGGVTSAAAQPAQPAARAPRRQFNLPGMPDPPAPVAPEVITRGENGRVVVRATRVDHPLVIDGTLDEPFYKDVKSMSDFIQTVPNEGQPASERTEAWLAHYNSQPGTRAQAHPGTPRRRRGPRADTLRRPLPPSVLRPACMPHRTAPPPAPPPAPALSETIGRGLKHPPKAPPRPRSRQSASRAPFSGEADLC